MTTPDPDARFWDREAEKYSKSAIADQEGYERTLGRVQGLLQNHYNVVELGCGTGMTAMKLAGSTKSYLGTDIAPKMIEIANQRNTGDTKIPGLSFSVATSESLTTAADHTRYDAVLAFNYLHLVRDLPGTLRNIHGLLQPGGLFIGKSSCLRDMNALIWWAALPAMRAIGKAPHCGVFSETQLKDEIVKAGFEIVTVERHGIKIGILGDSRPFIVARKT